jgi:hypothetical protein
VEIARLNDTYWQKHFNGARRLVGVLPTLVPTVISPAQAALPPQAPADPVAEAGTPSGAPFATSGN